jgi:phage terminase large subunit-like protein
MYYLTEMLKWNEENGILLNKDLKKSIEKQRRIHTCGQYVYKKSVIDKAIGFVEENFYKTTGDLGLIKLFPCQKWWWEIMVGYYTKDDETLFNEIFLQIIRGAGKSTLMAPRILYGLMLDDKFGSESQVIAYDNEQAKHVFQQVLNQASVGGGLFEKMGNEHLLKTTKTGIAFTPLKNTFRKQTNDNNSVQGGNTFLNVFDEVHTYKNDVITHVNMGSRNKQKNWQSIYITSGGLTRGGLYDSLIERFTSEADFLNDRTFNFIYRLDDISEVSDENNWSKASPMSPFLPKIERVREQFELSKNDPIAQSAFLAMNMGLQMSDVSYYFNADEVAISDYDMREIWQGAQATVGIDLSSVGDLTSVAFYTEKDNLFYAHTLNFIPRRTYEKLDIQRKELYERFESQGGLFILDREYIRLEDVTDEFERFRDKYDLDTVAIGYDRHKYEAYKEYFDNNGFFDRDGERQRRINQGFALSDYIKLLKVRLEDKTVKHNQKILEWSLMNTSVKIGYSEDLRLYKQNVDDKIDPTVAVIMAMKAYMDVM